jgi:hypothetical protein
MTQDDLFADEDPFVESGDKVLPDGSSIGKDVKDAKPTGFKRFEKTAMSLEDNLASWYREGSAEKGAGKKRKKPVNHKARSITYFERLGYTVEWLERFVTLPSGSAFKTDYHGLWDLRARQGDKWTYAQICGNHKDVMAHIRKMTSDKPAFDNRRKLIDNLRMDLDTAICCILSWEMMDNGRYQPHLRILSSRDVDEALARKRKK